MLLAEDGERSLHGCHRAVGCAFRCALDRSPRPAKELDGSNHGPPASGVPVVVLDKASTDEVVDLRMCLVPGHRVEPTEGIPIDVGKMRVPGSIRTGSNRRRGYPDSHASDSSHRS